MTKRSETLLATLAVLDQAGINYRFAKTGGGHYRVDAVGLPPIFCSNTVSDSSAAARARGFAKRLIKNPPPRRDIT